MLLLRSRALRCLALAAGALLGGCSYDDANGPGDRIDLDPARDTIVAGSTISPDDTLRIDATVVSDEGVEIPNAPVTWSSSAETVATVDSAGLVRAVGYGEARITARSGDREAVAIIAVVRESGDIGNDSVFTHISAGRDFTCASTSLGRAYCFGADSVDQLGAVATDTMCIDDFQPLPADRKGYACSLLAVRVQSDLEISKVAAGGRHGCALTVDGDALCWGQADSGQVGNGGVTQVDVPVLVTSAFRFDTVANGEAHSCAIRAGGAAFCWGHDESGQLGNIVRASSTTPIPVESGPGASEIVWRQISAGRLNSCGVANTGIGYCWGDNSAGQIGNPAATPQSDAPWPVGPVPGQSFTHISVGGPTACGVVNTVTAQSGAVYCWGAGAEGQLGNGANANSNTPVAVVGLPAARQVAVGETHVCAITEEANGNLYCWGRYDLDRLAVTAPNAPRDIIGNTPQKIGGVTFASISAGRRHACGVTAEGAAYCWGSNMFGSFGDGFQALLFTQPQRVQTPR